MSDFRFPDGDPIGPLERDREWLGIKRFLFLLSVLALFAWLFKL